MSDITLQFSHSTDGTDGYSTALRTNNCSYIAVQVTPDDTATWKLQGSLKDLPAPAAGSLDWVDIADSGSTTDQTVNADPVKYDVDLYNRIRVWVSDVSKGTTLHMKQMSGI